MKTIILTLVAILLILSANAQSSYGIYAGAQYCISHQKIICDNPSLIIKDNEPNMGYLAGFRYAFRINNYIEVINQTGYSQVNLQTPTENRLLSAHYVKSIFMAGVTPFTNNKGLANNISLESGFGIAHFLKGSQFLSAHHEMSKIEVSYDLGLNIPLKNLGIKPFMNISLTKYSIFDKPEIHLNYSFRTYGVLLIYQFKK